MSNIRKPILRYIIIVVVIVGALFLGYKTLFPKQYTEIEFGMSQKDLIALKGEPDEVSLVENEIYLRLEYRNDKHLGSQCDSWFEFSKSLFNESEFDKLISFGYRYSRIHESIDINRANFFDMRNKLIKIFGESVYTDNSYEFNRIYESGETVSTSWKYKNEEIWLFCSKESGLRVMYTK